MRGGQYRGCICKKSNTMKCQSALYRLFRNCLPVLFFALVAVASTGCKEDETTSVSGQDSFLENTEYGLYVGKTRAMMYQKYEHQLSTNSDGTAFRLQTDNLSKVVACTFSENPAHSKAVGVTLRTVGIPKVKNGTFDFTALKTESGKCWLWNKELQMGIIVPVE